MVRQGSLLIICTFLVLCTSTSMAIPNDNDDITYQSNGSSPENAKLIDDMDPRKDLRVIDEEIGREIQGQDSTGIVSEILLGINKLFGGNLSALGFAAGVPVAIGTAIFWGIIFLIIYHVYFGAKGFSDFGKFGSSSDDGNGDYLRRKNNIIPTPYQLSEMVNKAINLFKN